MIIQHEITELGQLKKGQLLLIQLDNGISFPATIKEVNFQGSTDEEVIFSKANNYYFLTNSYLKGESWAKHVIRVQDCKATVVINNFNEH